MHAGRNWALILLCTLMPLLVRAQTPSITINVDQRGAEVQPTMWGIFFEDINFGADGGLYAELVKNRSFEFDVPLMGWLPVKYDRFSNNSESGSVTIISRGDDVANPRYARISVNADNGFSLVNEGFFGMGFESGLKYDFSIHARAESGKHPVTVELLNDKNEIIGSTTLEVNSKDWTKYRAAIESSETCKKGKLRLIVKGKGSTDIDLVSLMPTDTWKNYGLRADLVQLLYDLKPGFLRFPGGCIVEGRNLAQRYQWKKTVGDRDDRELLINRWNTEFAHRLAPDYFQSFGLGFFEYFKLAEDIGAFPLPILSCGIACQFNTAEVVPLEAIDPYIQDALDLIEFANGDVNTTWGKLRSEMGHPASFNLTMIGVGNEQWGPDYIERFKVFVKAIKAKYPAIRIVSGTGPFPDGEMFDYAMRELKELKAEIVDEHYYRDPEWFFRNAARYDSYDRNGPKIFAGEYAAQSVGIASSENKNSWLTALSEAAFMTGLERNADIVHLSSYAPLLAHAEGWQWTPDLIWFDNLNAYSTPNYHVQKLFSTNRGTHTLSALADGKPLTGQDGLFASVVIDRKANELIVKIVNRNAGPRNTSLQLSGRRRYNSKVAITTLSGALQEENSFSNPEVIQPSPSFATMKGKTVDLVLAPASVSVLKIAMK